MNPVLVALIPGLLVGVGIAGLIAVYAPRRIRATDALSRLGEAPHVVNVQRSSTATGPLAKASGWLASNAPDVPFFTAPTKDLNLLQISESQFYARKIQYPLLFATIPIVAGMLLVPFVPSWGALVLLFTPVFAAIGWIAPDSEVRTKAAKARAEFTRFVAVYLQMVAVALLGNVTPDRALTTAAATSDAWVFQRIRKEFAQADLTRTSKWDALEALGAELNIPALVDLGRTMRMGEARVSLRDQLRSASDKLTNLAEAEDRKQAARQTKRVTTPVMLTIFPVIVLALAGPVINQLTR